MKKLLILVLSTVASSIGWWMGARFGIMTAFIASMIGLGLGIWGGARLADHWGA